MLTRFAPSITGFIHLGHIYHLLVLLSLSKKLDLTLLLRIEDHDKQRFKQEYLESLFADLKFLGIQYKEPALFQSRSKKYYDDCLNILIGKEFVYGCECSRSEIMNNQNSNKNELHYSGKCRNKNLPLDGNTIRFRVENKDIQFNDLILGHQIQNPFLQCGDFSIRDKLGNYTYQFACVCDDIRQKITHVIRGKDILKSTARQILLHRAFESPPPNFYHHRLLYDENGNKLCKRDKSESISNMIKNGYSPEEIFAKALNLKKPISLLRAYNHMLKGIM